MTQKSEKTLGNVISARISDVETREKTKAEEELRQSLDRYNKTIEVVREYDLLNEISPALEDLKELGRDIAIESHLPQEPRMEQRNRFKYSLTPAGRFFAAFMWLEGAREHSITVVIDDSRVCISEHIRGGSYRDVMDNLFSLETIADELPKEAMYEIVAAKLCEGL